MTPCYLPVLQDDIALDPAGRAVVLELKRGNDEKHLLQALSYAAMLSKWTSEDFLRLLNQEQRDALDEFLDGGSTADLNASQRVILIAEAFDYQVLITAEWLSEMYGVDIACCRIGLSVDQAGEYLTCNQILPAPELADQALRRGAARVADAATKITDWTNILSGCKNEAATDFFRKRLAEGQHNRPLTRDIVFPEGGGRNGWYVKAQQAGARVFQAGRFAGDEDFWRTKISNPETLRIRSSNNGDMLIFKLFTPRDFTTFQEVMDAQGQNTCLIRTRPNDLDNGEE